MLVDDDEIFRLSATEALRTAGFTVVEAADYRDALPVLEGNAPVDLLITDLIMPQGINGFALARMARLRRRNLPVLHVTGYDVPAHEAVGKVLRKPIVYDFLIAEARRAIETRSRGATDISK